MIKLNKKIVLASKSPRRKALLEGLDLSFTVRTKDTAEEFPSDLPVLKVASYLSKIKADAMLHDLAENEIMICADTVVLVGERILNKPETRKDAITMLIQLSGKVHKVITGVTIMDRYNYKTFDDIAEVYFKELTPGEIEYYVDKYNPIDKAGAYGIQEWIGFAAVEKIEGSFYTVMGLPVHKVYEILKEWK
jgi:septum formation protein